MSPSAPSSRSGKTSGSKDRSPSRRHGGSRRGRPLKRKARRMALVALSPATMLAALVMCGVTLAVWSCSTFDASTSRRKPWSPASAGAATVNVPKVPMYSAEPDIRVRIRQGVEEARIESPAVLMLSAPGMRAVAVNAPVTVASGPGGIRFVPLAGDALQYPPGITVSVSGPQTTGQTTGQAGQPAAVGNAFPGNGSLPAASGHIRLEGIEYPGTFIIRPTTDAGPAKFDLVADMSIEDYLPGVLAKELFAKWPLAAYESQAVCARTYALFVRDLDRAAGHFFDVENTQADQVFGGDTTNANANAAVRNTRGVVLTYNGGLFKAYFSSTCGGRPGSAADVWPISKGFEYNLAAPIQGKPREHYCQQARLYRWEVTRSADDLSRRLAAWGRNSGHPVRAIGAVRTVSVEKTNETTRPCRYAITDDRGRTFSLSAEELRVGCNASADGLAPITPATRINSNDLEFEPAPPGSPPGFIIRGRGFGHGVGMCQWCLKGLADRGVPWNQQVLLFYPGAQITKVYN